MSAAQTSTTPIATAISAATELVATTTPVSFEAVTGSPGLYEAVFTTDRSTISTGTSTATVDLVRLGGAGTGSGDQAANQAVTVQFVGANQVFVNAPATACPKEDLTFEVTINCELNGDVFPFTDLAYTAISVGASPTGVFPFTIVNAAGTVVGNPGADPSASAPGENQLISFSAPSTGSTYTYVFRPQQDWSSAGNVALATHATNDFELRPENTHYTSSPALVSVAMTATVTPAVNPVCATNPQADEYDVNVVCASDPTVGVPLSLAELDIVTDRTNVLVTGCGTANALANAPVEFSIADASSGSYKARFLTVPATLASAGLARTVTGAGPWFSTLDTAGVVSTQTCASVEVVYVNKATASSDTAVCPRSTIFGEFNLWCEAGDGSTSPASGLTEANMLAGVFPFTFENENQVGTLTGNALWGGVTETTPGVYSWSFDTAVVDTVGDTTDDTSLFRGEYTFKPTNFNLFVPPLESEYPTQVSIDEAASGLSLDDACVPLTRDIFGDLTLVCSDGSPLTGLSAAELELELGTEDVATLASNWLTLNFPVASTLTLADIVGPTETALGSGVYAFRFTPDVSGEYALSVKTTLATAADFSSVSGYAGISAVASQTHTPTGVDNAQCMGDVITVAVDLVCFDDNTDLVGITEAEFNANVEFALFNTFESALTQLDQGGNGAVVVTWGADTELGGRYTLSFTPTKFGEPAPGGKGEYLLSVSDRSTNQVLSNSQDTIVADYYIGSSIALTLVNNDPNNVPQTIPGYLNVFYLTVEDCDGAASARDDHLVPNLTAAEIDELFDASLTAPSGNVIDIAVVCELTGYPGVYKCEYTIPIDSNLELGVWTLGVFTSLGVPISSADGSGSVDLWVAGPPCEDVFTFEIDWTDFRDSCMEPVRLEQGGVYAVYDAVLTISYDDIVSTTAVSSERGLPTEVVRTNQFQKPFSIRFQRIIQGDSDALVVSPISGPEIVSAIVYVEYDELTEALTFRVDTWIDWPWQLSETIESSRTYTDFPLTLQLGTVLGTGPEWNTTKVTGECLDGSVDDRVSCHQSTFIRVRPEPVSGRVGWAECDWLNLNSGRIPVIQWTQDLQCRATESEPSTCGAAAFPSAEWDDIDYDFTLDLAFVNFCPDITDIAVEIVPPIEIFNENGEPLDAIATQVTQAVDAVGPVDVFDLVIIRTKVQPVDLAATALVASGSSFLDLSVTPVYTGEGESSTCESLAGTTAGPAQFILQNGAATSTAWTSGTVAQDGDLLVFDAAVQIEAAIFQSEVSGCNVAYTFTVKVEVDYDNDGIGASKRAVRAIQSDLLVGSTDSQLQVNEHGQGSDGNNLGRGGISAGAIVGIVLALVVVAALVAGIAYVKVFKAGAGHAKLVDELDLTGDSIESSYSSNAVVM